MIKKIFLLVIFFLNISQANLILDGKKEYDNFIMQYSTKDISSIETIDKINFNKPINNNFALGHQKEIIWLKIDMTNDSNTSKYILNINEHFYEEIELYYKVDNNWKVQKDGFAIPLKEKNYQSIAPIFTIDIPVNFQKTYYLKLKTKFAKFGKITIYEQNYYHHKTKSNIDYLYLFSFGVVLIIIIFTLFLSIKIKDKIYIFYLFYNIFYFIYLLNQSGLLGYINLSQYTYTLQALSSGFALVFLINFSNQLLNTKKHLPKTYNLFIFISFITIINTPLYILEYSPWNEILNKIFSLTMIILIGTSIYIYIKGNKNLKYYIFAIVLYFIFIISFVLMVTGKLPYNFITRYGYIFASMVETIIFSLILATRYNELKNRTIKIHKDLLHQRNKTKKFLQSEVEKQTAQIIEKNTKLENLVNERELLLKEVYHRVKNNFQVVISMLWFEGKKSPQSKQSYLELINRIKSMSTVHQYLYNSKDLSHIQLDTYIMQIVNNLKMVYEKKEVNIDTNIEKIDLEFNDAMTLGIIINEIVSNAIKHHKKNNICKIELNLKQEKKMLTLNIKDNGEGFDISKTKQGIGLNLIKDFTKKLPKAESYFKFNNGTEFYIRDR